MATKKKEEDVKAVAKKTATAKAATTKTATKTATKTVKAKATVKAEASVKAEKVAEEKTATKKVVAKVAKKPTATDEKIAAKSAPAKKTKAASSTTARSTKAKADVTTAAAEVKTAETKTEKKTRTTATKAKKVAEVVETAAKKDAAPEAIPQTFDAEYLVLMQKDPNWMQAFWEVSENRIEAAKNGKGKLVLRLFDVTNDLTVKRNKKHKFHDVVVPADARSWYVENKISNNCKAQLGVVAAGKFEPIVETGPMQTFTLDGSAVNTDNVFVRASLGGAAIGGFGSSGLSSMSAKNWLESLSSSSGSMFSGALSSAALKSNKLELPKDSVNYGDFFLWVKTRLIVYGGTRPDAHLQVRGEQFPLNPDGTFRIEEELSDATKIIPVFATDKDGNFPTTIVPIVVKRTE